MSADDKAGGAPALKLRGDPIDRVDGRLKVTGAAAYAAEVDVARVAHAVLFVSSVARGRITHIDTSAARAAPGVLAVVTHENVGPVPRQPDLAHKASPGDRVLQVFEDDLVRYSNQPIGVAVADTLERARHAARLVIVRYETEPPIVSLPESFEVEKPSSPRGADPSQKQPLDFMRGDPAVGLVASAVRVDHVYTTPFETHNPMEMHATIAAWHGPQHLTVYDSTQGIFEVRRKLGASLGIPKENVRVISKFVGGGFGGKGSCWSNVVIAALAARHVNQPVKLMVTRPQMFGPVGFRPPTRQHVVLGAAKDGRLTLIRHESRSSTSRFDEFVEHTTAPTRALYWCPNIHTSERLTLLDTGTPQFMRAPGESTGSFAMECAMDELAVAMGIDPVELRLRNHADVDPESGKPWSSKSLKACYQRAAERFGWRRRDPRPGSMSTAMKDGNQLVGWGMATATYPAHQRGAKAGATLWPDGTASVKAGSQDIGTGTYTVMTQVAAETLGLPLARVSFDLGDTDMPETPGSGGSTTAASVGSAVRLVCLALREKLAALTVGDARSPLAGGAARDLRLDGARVTLAGSGRAEALAAVFARNRLETLEVTQEAKSFEGRRDFATRSFGAQFVEVRIDRDFGEVRVARVVSAFAAGRILNAKTARSQFIGGIVWGIGMGLHEQTVYDERLGRVMNADLAEYHVPVNLDVPPIDVIFVDEDDPHVNQVGVKGIGEIGITGVAAAIANAVYHATGKRVRDLPITPDKLL
ncbi:MAG TPA: xanthine dehydrogenase family protein molybdopterin-binding subunit [Polyangia bacterium]|nr:xanthine dehydrogenase family protein molybdopterin-binding subunit [Polyangia bacterium]